MGDFLVGIDIGGTMIKGALLNKQGELLTKSEIPTQGDKGPDKLIENIALLTNKLQKDSNKISSIGVGIAGVLDRDRHLLLESPNLPLIKDFAMKKRLEHELNLPVSIENDANVAAMGELWVGEGRTLDNFLLLTLGTGVGSGLILNKKLWVGENGKAGEFGHTIVDPNGAVCGCGKKGCLEAHSSGSAMKRMAAEAIAEKADTSLALVAMKGPGAITPKVIYTEANKGDRVCLEIFKEVALSLSIGISNVNNLLDIHNFIIGGGVSKAADIFKAGLLEEVQKRVFSISKDKINIHISRLGNDAGLYGAGFLAKQHIDSLSE